MHIAVVFISVACIRQQHLQLNTLTFCLMWLIFLQKFGPVDAQLLQQVEDVMEFNYIKVLPLCMRTAYGLTSSARVKAPTNLKHISLDDLVMPDDFPQHGRALLRAAINSYKSTARSRSPRPAGRVAYGFICFAFPCQLCSL